MMVIVIVIIDEFNQCDIVFWVVVDLVVVVVKDVFGVDRYQCYILLCLCFGLMGFCDVDGFEDYFGIV